MEPYVTSATSNNITTIEFFHPQSNSLPGMILTLLAQTIRQAGEEKDSGVIILRSKGEKAFCAGASFDELVQIQNEAEGHEFFRGFAKVINAMRTCPKMIIARIQGKCVGGGVGLASAADYAIAVKGSDVKLSELAIGIGPFVVGPAVERKIGTASFSALAMDATRWRSAEWAYEHGLFAELHDTLEAVDQSVQRLSETLAVSSPDAMSELKRVFWTGTEDWDMLLNERAAISGRLILSDHSKKAIEKFKTK